MLVLTRHLDWKVADGMTSPAKNIMGVDIKIGGMRAPLNPQFESRDSRRQTVCSVQKMMQHCMQCAR